MKKQAFNPFLPSFEYIPDSEPYVFGDFVYIYGSHDEFNGKGFCQNNYVTWSAPINDLGNWRFEGQIYDRMKDPRINKKSINVYAPDIQIGLDGKYYLYYSFNFIGTISVAICDKPNGNFDYFGEVHYKDGTPLGKAKNDPFMFDPAIFIDDDEKVYLYFGFSPKPVTRLYLFGKGKLDGGYVVELESDMLTVKNKPVLVVPGKKIAKHTPFKNHEFFEASSMRKINGIYYFIYSSDKNHELCYATSKHPTGPFSYGGTIISNADIGYKGRQKKDALNYYGNNHGSIVQILDKWYIFYHRQTNRHEFSRQACAEEITIDNQGHIDQVEMTSCGLNGRPLCGVGNYSAHIACNLMSKKGAGSYSPLLVFSNFRKHPYFTQSGKDREDNPDQYIANMRDGSIAGFKYFSFENTIQIDIVISGKGKGEMLVYCGLDQSPIAIIKVDVQDEEVTIHSNLTPLNKTLPLYFKYVGKGYINFHGFKLEK